MAAGSYRRLRRGWRRLRAFPPVAVDGLLAAAIAGVTMSIGSQYHAADYRDFDAQAYALTCVANLPLAFRRRAPVPALLCCCASSAWFLSKGYVPSFNLFGPLLAFYTVVALRPPRTAVMCATPAAATVVYSGLAVPMYSPATAIAQGVVAVAVAWIFGTGARRLADRNRRLLELTDQLRQEREERARLAVTEERLRIARELHDVVAHHMSVVSVQAGLARYVLDTDLGTARTAVDTIAGTSHEALEEMRRLLAVLRVGEEDNHPDGRPPSPAPGLSRLDELVSRVRAAGVSVDVVVTGPVRRPPPGVDLCAYRVVQESLTNVLKHAPSAHVEILLTYRPADFTIRVSDDGHGAAHAGAGTGHGLTGMRERARLYGGSVTAGPGPGGGYVVTLTLPLSAPQADGEPPTASHPRG